MSPVHVVAFLPGDRSRDLSQLDWKSGHQQDLGALLVKTQETKILLNFIHRFSAVHRLQLTVCAVRLNEGHTVYLERMIIRCMESEQVRQFKAIGGWKELQDSVRTHRNWVPG